MEDIELNVGGTKFKGVYFAILISFATTIGGGLYGAFEFINRMSVAESAIGSINTSLGELRAAERLTKIEGDLESVDIGQLQGKLAELGTTLINIMDQVKKLDEVEKNSQDSINTVTRLNEQMVQLRNDMSTLQQDMDDAWTAMDEIANPLGK
jgi:chromosome segregation ATPase